MIRLCDEHFEGPLDLEAPGIQSGRAGVFAVVCECQDGAKRMVAAEFAAAIDRELSDPENQRHWREPYQGRLVLYVWYAPASGTSGVAMSLARAVRERYIPWCARTPNQRGEPYPPDAPE